MSAQRVPNRDVNAATRVTMALSLRAKKMTYAQIAMQCGYKDESAARKAVKRELQRVCVQGVEELRNEELLTLDHMQQECMTLFLDTANKARLFAADRILAIMERRAKLMGLDKTKDGNVTAQQVIIREVPAGLLSLTPEATP